MLCVICWQENNSFILYRVYLCVTLLVTLCYPVGYALCDYAGNSFILYRVYLCVTLLDTLCYPVGYTLCDYVGRRMTVSYYKEYICV